jgi:hypothetical protein
MEILRMDLGKGLMVFLILALKNGIGVASKK